MLKNLYLKASFFDLQNDLEFFIKSKIESKNKLSRILLLIYYYFYFILLKIPEYDLKNFAKANALNDFYFIYLLERNTIILEFLLYFLGGNYYLKLINLILTINFLKKDKETFILKLNMMDFIFTKFFFKDVLNYSNTRSFTWKMHLIIDRF